MNTHRHVWIAVRQGTFEGWFQCAVCRALTSRPGD